MSEEFITPLVTKSELAIFELGQLDERERIIKLLEQTESPSHLWGGIGWAIALIRGEK